MLRAQRELKTFFQIRTGLMAASTDSFRVIRPIVVIADPIRAIIDGEDQEWGIRVRRLDAPMRRDLRSIAARPPGLQRRPAGDLR